MKLRGSSIHASGAESRLVGLDKQTLSSKKLEDKLRPNTEPLPSSLPYQKQTQSKRGEVIKSSFQSRRREVLMGSYTARHKFCAYPNRWRVVGRPVLMMTPRFKLRREARTADRNARGPPILTPTPTTTPAINLAIALLQISLHPSEIFSSKCSSGFIENPMQMRECYPLRFTRYSSWIPIPQHRTVVPRLDSSESMTS